jgi:threonylcarbamoyladenosine tRNA methylthiotransferase MtaB
MPNQVPVHVARERNRILRELAAAKKLEVMRGFVGRRLPAITLATRIEGPEGTWTEALTDNYLKVKLRGRHEPNRWVSAEVASVEDGHLIANFCSSGEQAVVS